MFVLIKNIEIDLMNNKNNNDKRHRYTFQTEKIVKQNKKRERELKIKKKSNLYSDKGIRYTFCRKIQYFRTKNGAFPKIW